MTVMPVFFLLMQLNIDQCHVEYVRKNPCSGRMRVIYVRFTRREEYRSVTNRASQVMNPEVDTCIDVILQQCQHSGKLSAFKISLLNN